MTSIPNSFNQYDIVRNNLHTFHLSLILSQIYAYIITSSLYPANDENIYLYFTFNILNIYLVAATAGHIFQE